MSMRSRVQTSCRVLPIFTHIAAPKEPLLCLYPRWFSTAHRLLEERTFSYTKSANRNDSSKFTTRLSTHGEWRKGAIGKLEAWEHKTVKTYGKDKTSEPQKHIATQAELQESWDNAFLEADDWNSKSFQLTQDQKAQVGRRTDYASRRRDAAAITNSVLKTKGSWSYDWRIILLDLQQNTPLPEVNTTTGPTNSSFEHIPQDGTSIKRELGGLIRKSDALSGEQRVFIAWVRSLTRGQTPRAIRRFLHKQDDFLSPTKAKDAHQYNVRDRLMKAFQNPKNLSVLSHSAFHTAMKYLCDHALLSDARKLINIMTETNVLPTTNSFNIMLWTAAKRHDLHNFTYLLKLMLQRDIKPNQQTWCNFIRAIESKIVKLKVAENMQDMGLVNNDDTIQKVAMALLQIDVENHKLEKDGLTKLVAHLDERYGTRVWFTTYSANSICHSFGENGSWEHIIDVLKLMDERSVKPDQATLNITLLHCMRIRDAKLAHRFLTIMQQKYGIVPMQSDFEHLFMIGWRTRSYNLCRLIWSVACSKAAVSFKVQQLVLRSLDRNTPKDPTTDHEIWGRQAGKVIVGPSYTDRPMVSLNELLDREGAIEKVDEWHPMPSRAQYSSICRQLIAEDMTASGRFVYTGDFLKDFKHAITSDVEWKRQGSRQDKDSEQQTTMWKVKHVIRPKFERKLLRHAKVYNPKPSSLLNHSKKIVKETADAEDSATEASMKENT